MCCRDSFYHYNFAALRYVFQFIRRPSCLDLQNNIYEIDTASEMADSLQTFINRCADDAVCSAFKMTANILNKACHRNNVFWFAWNEFAIQLLREEVPKTGPIDVYLASEHNSNFFRAVEIIIISFKTNNCSVTDKHIFLEIQCNKYNIYIHVFGNALILKNELHMTGSNLIRSIAYNLNRVIPLATVPYYDTCVPVPNDPLYVFSHIMPNKNSHEAALSKYKYNQGCDGLCTHRLSRRYSSKIIKTVCKCSVTFCSQCSLNVHRDAFFPLKVLLKQSWANGILYLEDFVHVIPLEKGTGTYQLTRADGTNNAVLSWSQYGQDLYVDKYYKRKHNGFFVEIGGLDGERFSNTLLLEKSRHWNGILIEAIPRLYNQMKQKDRNCFILNACVSSEDDMQIFIDAEALSSSEKAMTKQHKDRIDREHMQKQATRINVYCKRFIDILNKLGQYRVDYFSLDVEGGELIILNGIPWEKVDIELFTIETDQHRDEIVKFMKSKGYENIKTIQGDDVFRKQY